MWGLEKNQAAQMGLLSAGAAMLDPRGTGGNIGSAINKSVQAGMGTYLPMMQWQQNKKDRKEDRDWNKNQDIIRNVLAERQFKLRKATAESELENREASLNMQRARFGMAEKQFQMKADQMAGQQQALAQWQAGTKVNPEYANQPPLMAINPATNQPFGNQPQPPRTLPLTAQDRMGLMAQMQIGGLDSGAAKTMMESQFSPTDPNSPTFSPSAAREADVLADAQRLVADGTFPTLAEARNALRSNMDIGKMIRAQQYVESMKHIP